MLSVNGYNESLPSDSINIMILKDYFMCYNNRIVLAKSLFTNTL